MNVSQIANSITVSRIILIPVLAYCLYHNNSTTVILFILIALSDILDGLLARALNCVSEWGALMDPIADKLLCNTMLIMLSLEHLNALIPICTMLICTRDCYVTFLRTNRKPADIPVSQTAKIKSIILATAIGCLLYAKFYPSYIVQNTGVVLLLISTILTLSTFVHYTKYQRV